MRSPLIYEASLQPSHPPRTSSVFSVVVLAVIAACLLMSASPMFAGSSKVATVGELYREADLVIRGIVLSSEAGQAPDGSEEAVITIQPIETFKGGVDGHLTIREPEGKRNWRIFDPTPRPRYTPGREVIVFASSTSGGQFRTVKQTRGKFEIWADEEGQPFAVSDASRGPLQLSVIPAELASPNRWGPQGTVDLRSLDGPRGLEEFSTFLRMETGSDEFGSTSPSGSLQPVMHAVKGSGFVEPASEILLPPGCIFENSTSSTPTIGIFVAPYGNDSNAGTINSPFQTIQRAHNVAVPGDTIYVRGGTYSLPSQAVFTRSGTSSNPIKIQNYPGETATLDGAANSTPYGHSIIRLYGASWWIIDGLRFVNSPGPAIYLANNPTNIIIRRNYFSNNIRLDASGAAVNGGGAMSNVLVENNDFYRNGKIDTGGGDGIGFYGTTGSGNVIRGNRLWRNNDDGIDLFDSTASILVEGNWSWENGYGVTLVATAGDGDGFKLGSNRTGAGGHVVRNNLAWRNKLYGFDQNGAQVPITLHNNTAWNNAHNYAFAPAVRHVLRNNISYARRSDGSNNVSFNSVVDHTFNNWNLSVTVNAADFASLDFSNITALRQADGSLPVLPFLRLVSGSDLINVGTNVGLPFNGTLPDLGAFEFTP
jgi:hypothetical protein